ncbi:SDR family NAD(P)-dependent oxidoreductase [Desertihabitans brevis]|uniref:SDR family NAD(P)-dependent oxidoreductase n=1 Tax=Desertihabitans brevis TaxID=2268447 RepID=A0A367YZZ8_9ACTN|nr:SDR family NAD(P)-dependent oxidoreductase [Desertihabitans brevis]
MELGLEGKRAFVSGSTQGIGYSIARALLAEGAEVIVNGRSAERVDAAVRELKRAVPHGTVSGLTADFAEPEQVRELLDGLDEIDVLVNNVGVFEVGTFGDISDRDWQRYFDINVMSGVRLSRHALPSMLGKGWGRIIFIGSEAGVDVPADMTHYGTTKAGVLALANGLAKTTRGTAVTVNTVLGGPTYSEGVASAVEQAAEARGVPADEMRSALATARATSLLQRFIEPDEIAHLVTYLASPLSSATNGAALRAEGGVLTTTL